VYNRVPYFGEDFEIIPFEAVRGRICGGMGARDEEVEPSCLLRELQTG